MADVLNWITCGVWPWLTSFVSCGDGEWFGINTITKQRFDRSDWLWGTLYLFIKEYITVVLQLVLFSRIGTTPDFLTGALILFMMLVSFGFPFMSSYLFFVLRMGPFNKDETVPYPLGTIRNLLQTVFVIIAHVLAALSAARFLQSYADQWKSCGLQMKVADSAQMVSWLYIGNDPNTGALPMADEFLNTFIFLIGLLHLLAKHLPAELMLSAYFNVKQEEKNEEDNKLSVEQTLTLILGKIEKMTPRAKKDVNDMKPLPDLVIPTNTEQPNQQMPDEETENGVIRAPRLTTDVASLLPQNPPSNQRLDNKGKPYTFHIPIPADFIVHVCILLAATTRAFPTAHGTPAISLYLYFRDFVTDWKIIQYRIAGGVLGSVAALLHYYIWYVWPAHNQIGPAEEFVKRIIVAPPAFLYSELQLPNNMKTTRSRRMAV